MEQETEVSIERPVVSAFLKVELGSFKVTMKTDCADLCTEDSRVNTKVLCSVGKFACERHQDFNLGSDGGFLKPAQRKKMARKEGYTSNDWCVGAEEHSSVQFSSKTTSSISNYAKK